MAADREPTAAFALRAFGSRWLGERKRLYREWERIGEIDAQAATLVDELRRRRDGQPARFYDLWAVREALAEVDSGR
jgi:hypothetical protein